MIRARVPIIIANHVDAQRISMSPEACQDMVEKFQKMKTTNEKMFVVLPGNKPVPVGTVTNLELVEEQGHKVLMAELELMMNFQPIGQLINSLQTPEGQRIVECHLKAVRVSFDMVPPPQSQPPKPTTVPEA